jgi:hypothetical protein
MTAKSRLQIDLAELASEPADLTLPDGTVVEVQPPELGDFLGIARLSDDLDDATTPAEILERFAALKEELVKIIPQLENVKINLPQTRAIIEGLNALTIPSDLKELEEQNIKPIAKGKKVASASSKK